MTPDLWQRLKPLYNEALDLPEESRAGFVAAMSAADTELARELRALLAAAHSQAQSAALGGKPNTPPNALPSALAGALPSGASSFHSPFHDVARWLPRQSALLAAGTVLAGRFRIVRHLGSGGMGEVYEALDAHMADGPIALKVIRPSIAGNPAALARFKDEVRLARKVSGPNVCRIHELHLTDPDPSAHGTVFLTMELLEGVTLHEHIAAAGPLPVPELRSVADQLCTALCCIHQAGIVHGDLKPRNVMLVPNDGAQRAVVMDFGLACVATEANRNVDGLGSGVVAGTPSYMAPEQFEGCDLGPPTDIYALGLMLYEMATGIQPYAAHTPLAAAIRRSKPALHASTVRHDLPAAWDEAITRCLQYDPKARFGSAAELSVALRRSPKMVLRLGHEHRVALPKIPLLAASAALLLVLAAGLWQAFGRPHHRELSLDATHWYTLGMTALREGSYMKATRLLTMVTARDPTYAPAHAALADAWNELDFTENAQREMLHADGPAEQRGLNDTERLYIDAVRHTLVREYSAATDDYRAILSTLPPDRESDGYVDLGRISEKAGNVTETIAAYKKASVINPDDPAPFLHLGILFSRLRQASAAHDAFARAESLYEADSNQEGLAEVAYQRGYAAVQAGKFEDAKQHLDQSLAIARQIPSPQLEVRSLSQLSSAAYNGNQDDLAIQYAQQAIKTSDENGLEYWSTDGLIHLGVAYLSKEDFVAAEPALEQALGRAKQNGHSRLNALAELTLASLRNQQKRWDEQIKLASSALKYFQDYGYLDSADQAQTLVLRGERDKGEFEASLQAGNQLLQIANATHSNYYVAMAEEFVGGALMRLERYPEALTHFEQGKRNLQSRSQEAYLQVHVAEALVELGRFAEAESALAVIAPEMQRRADLGFAMAAVRAQIKESLGDSQAARSIAGQTWAKYPSTRSEPGQLDRIAILAEGQSGQLEPARERAAQLASSANAQANVYEVACAELLEANLDLMATDGPHAKEHALAAEDFFEAKHIPESQALSLLAGAQAANLIGDEGAASALSQKSVDIFRQLEQAWGVSAFTTYANRPDRRKSLQALARLRGENGLLPHDLAY